MLTDKVIRAYRWFRENGAACVVGRCAENALALAKAEAWAEDQGVEFKWEYEYEVAPDDMPEGCEFLMAAAVLGNESLASLGGIQIFPRDRRYRRMIEAELAVEALWLWTLRQKAVARALAFVEANGFDSAVAAFKVDAAALACASNPRDGTHKAEVMSAYLAALREKLHEAAGWKNV